MKKIKYIFSSCNEVQHQKKDGRKKERWKEEKKDEEFGSNRANRKQKRTQY